MDLNDEILMLLDIYYIRILYIDLRVAILF